MEDDVVAQSQTGADALLADICGTSLGADAIVGVGNAGTAERGQVLTRRWCDLGQRKDGADARLREAKGTIRYSSPRACGADAPFVDMCGAALGADAPEVKQNCATMLQHKAKQVLTRL